MNVLVVSTMYPNNTNPTFGVFVKRRVEAAGKHVDATIVSPVPYFPGVTLLRHYAHRRNILSTATVGNYTVHYPKFLSVPHFLRPLDGFFLFLSLWFFVRRKKIDFDLIDAHLAFPDGFGALLLGRVTKKPVTVTLRGHDINVLPKYPLRRRQIRWVLRNASRVMAVAEALRKAAIELGLPAEKSETIPNAVDEQEFFPVQRKVARAQLGLPVESKIIVGVGSLIERKGYHVVLHALTELQTQGVHNVVYAIVGAPGEEGDYSTELNRIVGELNLGDAVRFVGRKDSDELHMWYSAADCSCLASSKEGWANVILESLACGTPVVGTKIWGTPEVITSPLYGVLVDRSPQSIAAGLKEALGKDWDREELVKYASTFKWESVGERVLANYKLAQKQPRDKAH